MNRKLKQSSTNSDTSGTGRFSMFESSVTPFFTSMTDGGFDTQMFQKRQGRNREIKPSNTQECIERLVQQNQFGGFHSNVQDQNQGFGLQFSFAYEFKQGEDTHFSFDDNEFHNNFTFLSNLQEQEGSKIFQSNAHSSNFCQSKAQSQTNEQDLGAWQGPSFSFTQTLTNEKKQSFYDLFSFQNDNPNQNFNLMGANQPKKRSIVEQLREEKKQSIIYEVDSKFECEGQTNIISNQSQSRSQSQSNLASEKKHLTQIDNKPDNFEALRQSIIKEISQMGSDQWDERNDDFVDTKIQRMSEKKIENFPISNKKNDELKVSLKECRSSEKRKNFNESIINKLIDSDLETENNQKNSDPFRTSRSMMNFCLKNDDQLEQNKEQIQSKQKAMENIYQSQVQEVTNQRIQMFKQSDKSVLRRRQYDFIEKQQKKEKHFDQKETFKQNVSLKRNNNVFGRPKQSQETKLQLRNQDKDKNINYQSTKQQPKKTQIQNKSETLLQKNQIKKKRPLFQIKPRNRFNIKNQVIDERQEFEQEGKEQINIKNQFMSENLQFQNDMDTKPIQLYQSAAKGNQYQKNNYSKKGHQRTSNDLRETSKKSLINMKIDVKDKNASEQQKIFKKKQRSNQLNSDEAKINEKKEQPMKQRKYKIFNFKKKSEPNMDLYPNSQQKKQVTQINNNNYQVQSLRQAQSNGIVKKNNRNRFQLNFNNRRNNLNNNFKQPTSDKLQKTSQASQTHSLSSDGIKMDTKGFLNNVLKSGDDQRNTKQNDHRKPIFNLKRLNRFSSMFAKDTLEREKKSHQNQNLNQNNLQEEKLKKNQSDFQNKKSKQDFITKTPKNPSLSKNVHNLKSPNFFSRKQKDQQKNSNEKIENLRYPNEIQNHSKNNFEEQEKVQLFSERDISYKSQQSPQLSLYSQRQSPSTKIIPKFTFSKRTPPKLSIRNDNQSKSKSVTFDTVKRIDSHKIIGDEIYDNLSYDSGITSQNASIKSFKNRETFVRKRQNNLMKGEGNNKKSFSSQNHDKFQGQRANNTTVSSSFPSISSRSRKSAEMMKKLLDLIQQAHQVHQLMRKVRRQSQEQYRRVCILDEMAKQKFSYEKIEKMSDWGELENQIESWQVQELKKQK